MVSFVTSELMFYDYSLFLTSLYCIWSCHLFRYSILSQSETHPWKPGSSQRSPVGFLEPIVPVQLALKKSAHMLLHCCSSSRTGQHEGLKESHKKRLIGCCCNLPQFLPKRAKTKQNTVVQLRTSGTLFYLFSISFCKKYVHGGPYGKQVEMLYSKVQSTDCYILF